MRLPISIAERILDWILSDKFVTIFTAFCAMIAAVRTPFSHREHRQSMEAIKENTAISTHAFEEANGAKEEIARIARQQLALREDMRDAKN